MQAVGILGRITTQLLGGMRFPCLGQMKEGRPGRTPGPPELGGGVTQTAAALAFPEAHATSVCTELLSPLTIWGLFPSPWVGNKRNDTLFFGSRSSAFFACLNPQVRHMGHGTVAIDPLTTESH